jgi:hypothetical protein
MFLRNRKQITLCRECHINVVHKGKYGGTKLATLAPKIMYDDRLINIESHLKPGKEYYAKTLKKRGWVQIQNSNKKTKRTF